MAAVSPYFEISALGDNYFTPSARNMSNAQLHGRFKLLHNQNNITTFFDMGAGGLVGEKVENYVIVPQAYAEYHRGDLKVTAGRKVIC